MDQANREILDYYLLPRIDIAAAKAAPSKENGFFLDSYALTRSTLSSTLQRWHS
jgi:hypothetical protein